MQVQNTVDRLPVALLRPVERGNRLAHFSFWADVDRRRRSLQETQTWSADQLADYQWEQARALLRHAYEHVPFYRRSWQALGIVPEDIKDRGHWRRLPYLTKSHLQQEGEALLADNIKPKQRTYTTTGGSTGMPVGVYFDKGASDAAERAFIETLWERVGYKSGDRNVLLRGIVLEDGQLWKLVPRANQLQMSSFYLTDEHIPVYLERMRSFQPKFIHAFPSSVLLMARFVLQHRLSPLPGLKAILCGSENLYDWQRQQIEEAFQCRVYSWFGQTEKVCLAGECEFDQSLHIFPEYGLTELIDETGQPIEDSGRVGEIIATGFLSRAMPLIRYRTMDFATYAPGPCPHCQRPYRRFERIEGRLQAFIVTRSGRYISTACLNFHTPAFSNVRQFRFYQDTPGEVVLRLAPKPGYKEDDTRNIQLDVAPKLGSDMQLTIELTDEIPLTKRGKHHLLEQALPITFGGE